MATGLDPGPDLDPGVDLAAGARNVQRVLAELHSMPARNRTTLHSQPVPQGWSRDAVADDNGALLDRGVVLRAVYPHAADLSSRQHLFLLQQHSMGIAVRLMPTVPTDLLIVDDTLAVLPVFPDHPGWALAILRDPAWVQAAVQIADACWASATAYAADPPGIAQDSPPRAAPRDFIRTLVEKKNACNDEDLRPGTKAACGHVL